MLRTGTRDVDYIVADLEEYRKLNVLEGDVVLDIGGHIGAFALQAYGRGAKEVVSFEPELGNIAAHKLNLRQHRHTLVEAAVVGTTETSRLLYLRNGPNQGNHTVVPTAGREAVRVAALNFDDVVQHVRPTVLKVDVEGCEYEYSWDLPASVRSIAVEFHGVPDSRAEAIHRKLLADFDCTYTHQVDVYELRVYERCA